MNITFTELPKNGLLKFEYQFLKTPVGNMLVVSWGKSLVSISFADNQKKALEEVQKKFPKSTFVKKGNLIQKQILTYFTRPKRIRKIVSLALAGTPFQIKVWRTLLKVSFGRKLTYSELAKKIGKKEAVRAVASAVAKNPIALLIPCHRVLPKSGGIGKYHWGTEKKRKLIAFENTKK